eukprot:TRINITY_DN5967_c0_g1_i1.p1 TRINITY_DN5967_c0_g1~~TRINITY_DN5967_c0_g1_i1.p1  ORF type:complete len:253 (-),score=82.64 TRINITY_DN5967_c0_g1_i1:185-838(-)
MALRIGDEAPDFTVQSTIGEFTLSKYLGGSWGLFFSHPADYTPVCTTELGTAQKLVPEFTKRNVKPFALSVDPVDKHAGWIKDINETQNVNFDFPIIADDHRTVSTLYGMLDQTNLEKQTGMPLTVRSVFIIDPSRKIRLILTYPASCGRNFDEILRVIDSLQLTDKVKVATPANWKKGDDAIVVPSIDNEKAKELFGGFTQIKPYLRTVKASQYQK